MLAIWQIRRVISIDQESLIGVERVQRQYLKFIRALFQDSK